MKNELITATTLRRQPKATILKTYKYNAHAALEIYPLRSFILRIPTRNYNALLLINQ